MKTVKKSNKMLQLNPLAFQGKSSRQRRTEQYVIFNHKGGSISFSKALVHKMKLSEGVCLGISWSPISKGQTGVKVLMYKDHLGFELMRSPSKKAHELTINSRKLVAYVAQKLNVLKPKGFVFYPRFICKVRYTGNSNIYRLIYQPEYTIVDAENIVK